MVPIFWTWTSMVATPAREIWYVFLLSRLFFIFLAWRSSYKSCCIYAFWLSSGDVVVVVGCLSQFRLARGAQNSRIGSHRIETEIYTRVSAGLYGQNICIYVSDYWHKQIGVNRICIKFEDFDIEAEVHSYLS